MLQDVKKLALNEGQSLASEGFLEFLFSDEKELSITGPGGVGKTFLMGHMIDEIMPRYEEMCEMMGIRVEYYDVHMTATTNKAAEVLGLQTGRPTSTVHSFFGLKVINDYDTGVSKISKSNSWQVYSGIILFIDEASMIDSDLYDLIQEGTHKCKVVYVGDKNQLAPVKETLSPVYKRPIKQFELLEPMRTAVPELQALNQQMRDVVNSGRLQKDDFGQPVMVHDFTPIKVVPGVIDWLSGPQFEAEIAQNFKEDNGKNVILAYTNSRVIEYNTHIRQMRGLPPEFTAGEHVISASAARFGKLSISVEDELFIQSIDSISSFEEIESGVHLEVRFASLENSFGEVLTGIPIPMDRNHYDALVKYYKKAKNWRVYYKLKEKYPDLRQRDARTVYKIQGSSIDDNVYIDAANLSTCHNPSQAARLLYVAVSRARKRVAFYDSLATKYGGIVL